MNIILAADHNGFEKKKILIDFLKAFNHSIIDAGNSIYDPQDDFPDYVEHLVEEMRKTPGSLGIAICGSGIGTSIAANKHKGIFCALCVLPVQAEMARLHAHANVLALSALYTQIDQMKEIVTTFLTTNENKEEKYIRRISKIKTLDLTREA